MTKNINTEIIIAGVKFKNPVTTASGTFASGKEYAEFVGLDKLGAVTTKGVSQNPWKGNPTPRVAETYGGMLNSVGLQNPGIEAFIQNDLPFLRKSGTNVIVNICGHSIDEYCSVAERLSEEDGVDMLELNISCPNVKEGGISFGTDWKMAEKVVTEVKKKCKKPLIVKLTPNVTDIQVIARAAESAGADALSLINTLLGMKIDIYKRKPLLGNRVGGLSGPAVKPVAVRMVWQTACCVKIPVIGMGGVMNGNDAIEFLMAGASAVAVGTANFADPYATVRIIGEIETFLIENGIKDIKDIIGVVK